MEIQWNTRHEQMSHLTLKFLLEIKRSFPKRQPKMIKPEVRKTLNKNI